MSVRRFKPVVLSDTNEEIALEAQSFVAERALVRAAMREKRTLVWGMNIAPTYRGFAVAVECHDVVEHLVPTGAHAELVPFYAREGWAN